MADHKPERGWLTWRKVFGAAIVGAATTLGAKIATYVWDAGWTMSATFEVSLLWTILEGIFVLTIIAAATWGLIATRKAERGRWPVELRLVFGFGGADITIRQEGGTSTIHVCLGVMNPSPLEVELKRIALTYPWACGGNLLDDIPCEAKKLPLIIKPGSGWHQVDLYGNLTAEAVRRCVGHLRSVPPVRRTELDYGPILIGGVSDGDVLEDIKFYLPNACAELLDLRGGLHSTDSTPSLP